MTISEIAKTLRRSRVRWPWLDADTSEKRVEGNLDVKTGSKNLSLYNTIKQTHYLPLPAPSSPSVSMTTTRCTGSIAAHTPTVQDSWVGDVVNTSLPRKNVWFRVWDLPSPVFPKMHTTLRSSSVAQPSLLTKSPSSFTWKSSQN